MNASSTSRKKSLKHSGDNPKDIWTILSETQRDPETTSKYSEGSALNEQKLVEPQDTYTLFVGPKSSGKSTLISLFLNPNKVEEPKPTVALDYLFARKTIPGCSRKAIGHIWELAASKRIKDIARVPLSAERIRNAVAVIVLDLSQPENALPYLIGWINALRLITNDVLTEISARSKNNTVLHQLKESAMSRFATNHPDLREVNPLPIPLLVLASKYDSFRDQDSIKRKILSQALRYVAHINGASIVSISSKEKNLIGHYRNVLNQYIFHTEAKEYTEVDPGKALVVTAGADSLSEIGIPRGARKEDFDTGGMEKRLKQWERAVSEYFPPSKDLDLRFLSGDEDEEKEEQNAFLEPAVDALRSLKREELKRYREKKRVEEKKKLRDKASK